MTVVADPEAVAFIAEHGGRLYIYTDGAGMKHVKTEPPHNASLRFEHVEADGFLMYVQDDLAQPDTWNVKFRHLPYHHIDVLWDGDQPGLVSWFQGQRRAAEPFGLDMYAPRPERWL
jgi:hypothetical protein